MSKTKKTKLPNGVSEREFLTVLENISKRLGHKFKFGYHSYEDMKQQAAIFALEGLEKYDNKRPLENFLWTHVRNRLFNYKRDNYQRPDKPCLSCRFYDKNCSQSLNQCTEYSDKTACEEYHTWNNRNTNKKNIMKPVGIPDLEEQNVSINKLFPAILY
jgi:DNA-directed RNA polymerase specialized sigma24 family protein